VRHRRHEVALELGQLARAERAADHRQQPQAERDRQRRGVEHVAPRALADHRVERVRIARRVDDRDAQVRRRGAERDLVQRAQLGAR
jgi:hypothetical protein